jgi:uncharacterized membrane protein
MKWANILKIVNILIPIIGLGLTIFYEVCDTSCSALEGEFLGVELKVVGIFFMVALLVLIPLHSTRISALIGHLKTVMLAGALGGEMLLVRFQIVHETYCPFCLAFGLCIVILFAANFHRMNRYLALFALFAGVGAFALLFKGSALPLYR